MNAKKKGFRFITEGITILCAFIYVIPVLLVVTNTFKPLGSILKNPFTLPEEMYLENIIYVLGTMKYFQVFLNTVKISVSVVIFTILISSMAGWMLTRDNRKISHIIVILLMASLMVPFQSFMIPLNNLTYKIGINDSMLGYIWVVSTLYAPMGVFMYTGFVKNVPASLEESAKLDGATPIQVFFRISFPLMKPITASISVLYSLWIWNDFLTASLMLKSTHKQTITIAIRAFFSMYLNRWDYAITAVAFSVVPISVLYILLQKYMVAGITAGAVKG